MEIENELTEKGLVLRIERGSIHDGDGWRTVVFLKGCSLNCLWCSTPESHSFQIEETNKNVYGKYMTVEEVMKEVRKDSTFFFHSGGGVTISGGEALSQPSFTLNILKASRREGIDTTIETSFFAPWETINHILKYVNTAIVDLKLYDRKKHIKYCGVDNNVILDNLMKTNKLEKPLKLVIRIPIIPGINDDVIELTNMAKFLSNLNNLYQVELLPYHRLGIETYIELGREYELTEIKSPNENHMEKCRIIIRKHIDCVI